MLNRYPLWKYLLILIICVVGVIYALPNLYPQDPAVQISTTNGSLGSQQLDRVTQALADDHIQVKSTAMTGNNTALIRLNDAEQQLPARDVVDDVLDDNYTVALNLADSTPSWLTSLSAAPMKLGLDLRGGVHFLLEVDMKAAVEQRLEATASAIRADLRDQRIRYRSTDVDDNALHLEFANTEDRDAAREQISQTFNEFQLDNRNEGRRAFLDMTLTEQSIKDIQDYAVQQNLTTIRNRVNELGVSEPLVQRQGPSRIVVELPGVQDTAEAKRIVGATANLEFRLEARPDAADSETETFPFRNNPQRTATLSRDVIITGDRVSSASQGFDQNGRPQVNINLDGTGGSLMNQATRTNIGRNMAVLYIDHSTETRTVTQDGQQVEERIPTTSRSIISLATVQSALSNRFRITGLDSPTEASELALLLRSGSLAAPIYFVQERTIGPSLGAQNIERGIFSVIVGGLLVVAFMLIRYKAFGVIANVALAANLVLLIAAMSLLGATLTLPGIAGIVLTLGMAVDANVLIYERIREELRRKTPAQQAIHAGYGRAFTSIIDANLTTLLVAVVLFSIGTGPIKGFAVTLSLGILTSMFTGIVVSRALVNLSIGGKPVKKLWI
ncbi:protein translocase subunit SecD [Salinicola corii]|uniref:Protein translocase subunit SecD n=1 Tax=Salinicola corii TaxID=2606937 RepID=A0A640WJ29_9GAMM|nr:protein translocase subunit SecD [Salinicola corii]KAA0020542.1 protein translocase subunit SecD [Salinicola corii]